ncbi:MAG: ABC-2 family transporter protein [Polyangiaceae bacterium]
MMLRVFVKYAAFARLARRLSLSSRAELYGRMLFLGLILAIFTALWRAIGEAGMPIRTEPARLVWYLAITEWIVLSTPLVNMDIEQEIRRGDVAYRLPRPVSYVGSLLFEGLGQLSVRLPTLGVAAFGFAWALTGSVPGGSARVLWVVPLAAFASVVLTSLYVLVGLLTFWLGESTPVYWVCQKLLFVLGGLMLPLELYPPLVSRVAKFTPFPSLLYAPASLVFDTGASAVAVATALAAWLAVLIALSAVLVRAARRRLSLSGG